MEKIKFEDGKLKNNGYIEIEGIRYEIVETEYEGTTPLSAFVMNKLQDNIEKSINEETNTLITTQEAEELEIQDACPVKSFLKIKGNSKQDTTATLENPVEIKNCNNSVNLKLQNENSLVEGYSTSKTNTNFYAAASANFIPTTDGWGKFAFDNTTGSTSAYINSFIKLNYFRKRLKASTVYRIVIEFRNFESGSVYDYFNICGGTPEEAFVEQRSYNQEQIKTNSKIVTYVTAKNEETLKNTNLLIRSFASITKGSKFSVECRVLISEDTNIQNYILGKEKAILFPLQANQKLTLRRLFSRRWSTQEKKANSNNRRYACAKFSNNIYKIRLYLY